MNTEKLTKDQITTSLTPIFHAVFDDESIALKPEMTAEDIAQWDSLTHINLVVAIEKEFNIKFKTAEVASLANVGDLIDTIQKKLP